MDAGPPHGAARLRDGSAGGSGAQPQPTAAARGAALCPPAVSGSGRSCREPLRFSRRAAAAVVYLRGAAGFLELPSLPGSPSPRPAGGTSPLWTRRPFPGLSASIINLALIAELETSLRGLSEAPESRQRSPLRCRLLQTPPPPCAAGAGVGGNRHGAAGGRGGQRGSCGAAGRGGGRGSRSALLEEGAGRSARLAVFVRPASGAHRDGVPPVHALSTAPKNCCPQPGWPKARRGIASDLLSRERWAAGMQCRGVVQSQNRRRAWAERDLKDHPVPAPCRGQRCHPPDQAAHPTWP